jgi:hypothetical protein
MLGLSISLTLGGQTYTGTVTPSTYLPTVTSSFLIPWGAKKMVAAHTGPLVQLQRSSDSATSDFSATGQNLDASAISTWAGGSSVTLTRAYHHDNSGNYFSVAGGTIGFDVAELAAGRPPIAFISTGYLSYTHGSAIFNSRADRLQSRQVATSQPCRVRNDFYGFRADALHQRKHIDGKRCHRRDGNDPSHWRA